MGRFVTTRCVGQCACGLLWLLALSVSFAQDFGDAPDTGGGTGTGNYQTLSSDSGARHTVSTAVRLGTATTDSDSGNLQNAAATSDDTTSTDDEDGIATFPTLQAVSGQTYTVSVNATNSSGSNAFLVGYVDFNRDGDFVDTGERSTSTVTVASSATNPRAFNVSFTIPSGTSLGTSYARFRISSSQTQAESSIGPTSGLTIGEVEDYQVQIVPLLAISKTATSTTNQNNMVTYRLKVWNRSTVTVSGVTVADVLDTSLINATWYCYGRNNARCTSSTTNAVGTGNLNLTTGNLQSNNVATPPTSGDYLDIIITATAPTIGSVTSNAASVTAPSSLGGASVSTGTASTTVTAVQSICAASGGTRGANLFDNNGTFGTLTGSPATSPPTRQSLPAGRTNYNYNTRTPVAFPGNYSPEDGDYDIANSIRHRQDGAWFNANGHTTGLATDMMMVVNASITPGVFYQQTINVTPNQIYEFTSWVINLIANSASILPNLEFEIDRIGLDDDGDPTTSDGNEGQTVAVSGDIPNSTDALWLNYGAFVNAGTATQIIVRLRNNQQGGGGNDLALDDLVFAPCSIATGTVSGFVYADYAANDIRDGSDAGLGNVTVLLRNASTNAIVATTQSNSSGSYSFTAPPGNYIIQVVTSDPDLPSLSTLGTTNNLAVTVTSGGNITNQNFGFDLQPVLGLAKQLNSITPTNNDPSNTEYALEYRLVIQNFLPMTVSSLSILDDLKTRFPPSPYNPRNIAAVNDTAQTIAGVGTCVVLNANSAYTTSSNTATTNVLVFGQSLAGNACGTVLVRVTVTVDHTLAQVLADNQASVSGSSPAGKTTTDTSVNGLDPDGTDNDSNPDENTTTPAFFVKLVKDVRNVTTSGSFAATAAGKPNDVLEYRIRFFNLSSQPINTLLLTDTLATTTPFQENVYGSPADREVQVVCPSSSTSGTVNLDKTDAALAGSSLTGSPQILSVNIFAATACNLSQWVGGQSGSWLFRAVIP